MYAQTLVYGLFVARYYDDSPDTFSRQESRDLVPASNPFLQYFFDHIAGPNFDKRLSYIVDELCVVFQHSDTKKLIEEYIDDADPVIHFYEDFLKEYDPALRKKMGAYYTPLPVVEFIVRSVDYILQKEFNLPNGLADTSKLPNSKHRIQILDPAVGTGTFISTTITAIHERLKEQGQPGRWPSYVHNDLLPRLYGFELMMTPYIIAHLKVSIALRETGFKYFNETKAGKTRLRVYLTNSLEQSGPQQELSSFGFAESIAAEAREANKIKNETPIMVVIGNPPYSGESSNKGEYALRLIDKYKFEGDGSKLKEKNSKWLNDDYVKFIAFAEELIIKKGEGILAFINNHSFLDNPTFRGMRYHLIRTFNKIYFVNLHGNSKKKEKTPDGGKDENVFDIQQGVSINIFMKVKDKKNSVIKIVDIYGKRGEKFSFLDKNNIGTIKWQDIKPKSPNFLFIKQDISNLEEYNKGFKVNELFKVNGTGIVTKRDNLSIDFDKNVLFERVNYFANNPEDEVRQRLKLPSDVRDWKFDWALNDLLSAGISEEKIKTISYRPFDNRYIYYTGNSRGFIGWPVTRIMQHFLAKDNVGLVTSRQCADNWKYVFVTKFLNEFNLTGSAGRYGAGSTFPLFLYSPDGTKTPNLKKEIVDEIEKIMGKASPEDIFDYIYAFLHSPSYREKYKEFLKIDFPRVLYPKDEKTFKKLVAFGAELRSLHLLESPEVNQFITTYPIAGSDTVEKLVYKNGNVFINAEQYFGNVPEVAWNFSIGGYQPAQKWLKDRKGCTLTNMDIEHYQKIIVALAETDRIMREIDSNI
jgi:predicted helicase